MEEATSKLGLEHFGKGTESQCEAQGYRWVKKSPFELGRWNQA